MRTNNANQPSYEKLLLENEDLIHQAFQDSLNCKIDAIRKTKVEDIEQILNLFFGPTLAKKREQLIDFLKLMPEYRTTDSDLLYQRLKALQEKISRTEGYSDLFFHAYRKYRNITGNENNEEG